MFKVVKLCTYSLLLEGRRAMVALVTQLRELFLLVFVYLEQNTGINVKNVFNVNLQGFDQTHYGVLYNLKLSSLPSKALF